MIHLIEGEKPEEGKIVRTKCDRELIFRPFSPSLGKMTRICWECDSGKPTKIPNFLAVVELSKSVEM